MKTSIRLLAAAVAAIFAGAAPVIADDGTARGSASLSGSSNEEGMTRNAGSDLEEESYTDDSEYEEPEYEEETPEYEQDLTTRKNQNAPVTPLYDTTTSSSSAAVRPEEPKAKAKAKATDTNVGQSSEVFPDVSSARAATDMRPHIGLLAGYNNVNGEPNANVGFGADAGFFPVDFVSLGAEIAYSPSSVDVGDLSTKYDTTNYLVRAYYHLGGDTRVIKDTYLGWKGGLAHYSRPSDSSNDLAVGPTLGMNFQVDRARKVTLGPEASYLFVLGSNAPDQFALNAALRYWF